MHNKLTLTQFLALYPNEEACLEEIKQQRFPYGIYCDHCNEVKRHYKVRERNVYACKDCRKQRSLISETLFKKSSTPLRQWFLALFIMTQTRGEISAKRLQHELGVTYKTAWRMHHEISDLMQQNDGDLLKDPLAEQYRERKWTFFNKLEIKVIQKQEPSEDEDFNSG